MVENKPLHHRPAWQEAILAKCVHPSGKPVPWTEEDTERSVIDRFEQIVRRFPDRCAVKSSTFELTYRELNEAANRIARAVLAATADASLPVALLLEQGAGTVAPMLGVLKAGRFFTSLEPDQPLDRLEIIMEDAKADLVLISGQDHSRAAGLLTNGRRVLNVDEIEPALPAENIGTAIDPDSVSLILYTSGSTGRPKGVMHTHRHVINGASRNAHHACPEDRYALLASTTGGAWLGIFHGLLNAAATCSFDVKRDGTSEMASWLRENEITILRCGSPLFRAFVQTLGPTETFPSVRVLRLLSQTVRSSDFEAYKKHFGPRCIFHTGLSITEVGAAHSDIYLDKHSEFTTGTVGYPGDAELERYLLDEDGNAVRPSEVGEIVLKSRFISLGYWRNEELTAATFLPDPGGSGKRIFHTGDLGREQPDGCLEHVGRTDFQVKIRGNRVEIPEIEALLFEHESVKDAVVVAREDDRGNRRLAAFVVPAGPVALMPSSLRDYLAGRLPPFMVPAYIVPMDALPQLPSGKVDRLALPDPSGARPDLQSVYVGPRSDLEEDLREMWADVLGIDRVGVHDDFLDLGGDSLLAASLIARIQQLAKRPIPLATLIRASTVAKMAEVVGQDRMVADTSSLIAIQPEGDKPPFFCVPAVGGHVFGLTALARRLGSDQPFYGLESPGRDGEQRTLGRVEDLATLYLQAIRQVQPRGPYFLGGYSWGGRIALEIAQRLRAEGNEVGLLAIIDSGIRGPAGYWRRVRNRARYAERGFRLRVRLRTRLRSLRDRLVRGPAIRRQRQTGDQIDRYRLAYRVEAANARAAERYAPEPYAGKIAYFWSREWGKENGEDNRAGWRQLAKGGLDVHVIPGTHSTIVQEPHVEVLASELRGCLEAARLGAAATGAPTRKSLAGAGS